MPTTITIARPNPDEHLAYYAGYIGEAPGDDGLESMRVTGESLVRLMQGVSDEKAMTRVSAPLSALDPASVIVYLAASRPVSVAPPRSVLPALTL